jgi:hypothetical protein
MEKKENNDTIDFGAGAFIQKDLGIGFIKAGFAYQFPPSYNGKTGGQGIFSIPVMIEMGF